MPNHFHAVCSQPEGKLADVMRDLKRHTSKAVAAKLKADGRSLWLRAFENAAGGSGGAKVWMDEYHPEQIHSPEFFETKLRYMRDNPIGAGYVVDPCEWKYSSAGFYYRDTNPPVPITPLEW